MANESIAQVQADYLKLMAHADKLQFAGKSQDAAFVRRHAIVRTQGGCYAGHPWDDTAAEIIERFPLSEN